MTVWFFYLLLATLSPILLNWNWETTIYRALIFLVVASPGIAMGTAGSDVALETADIVLMADRLENLEQAINLGRRSPRIVKQNITFALSFIVLLLVANFVGNITMPLGVIGHEGSTVLVTLSGLRLLRN